SFLFGLASTGGLTVAVMALVLTTAVLAFLEFVVEPRLFRRNQYSGVLIIAVIVMMVDAYGLIGFIIAPPLAVGLQVLGGHIVRATRKTPTATIEFETLEKRLATVDERYKDLSTPEGEVVSMPPEVASLYGRLATLINEARETALEEA